MNERMPSSNATKESAEKHNKRLEEHLSPEVRHRIVQQIEADYERLQRQFDRKHQDLSPAARDHYYQELKNSPQFRLHLEHVKMGSADIDIVGIEHTSETVLLRHKELFEAIQGADVIFLEGTPHAGGVTEWSNLKALQHEIIARGIPYTDSMLRANSVDNEFNQFFGHAELLAALLEKPVVTADPHSGGERIQKLLVEWALNGGDDRLYRLDDIVRYTATGAIGGTLAAASGLLMKGVVNHVHETPAEKSDAGLVEDSLENRKMSRRTFLAAGVAASAAAAAIPSLSKTWDVSRPKQNEPYFSETDTKLVYNLIDYRNTVTANGIKKYLEEHPEKKKVLVLYGDAHRLALKNYLEESKLLEIKHALYAPYRLEAHEQVQEYTFQPFAHNDTDGNAGAWKETYQREL